MELLKELMNRGYLIHELSGGDYQVFKLGVPKDWDKLDELSNFPTYDEALAFCKEKIEWIEPKTPEVASNSNMDTYWQMELMYKHRGLGLKSAILGQLKHMPYAVAQTVAKDRAEEYVGSFPKDEIESWEIRVRPCVDR